MRTAIRALHLVALLALAGGSVWAYQSLPARYPIHFDLAGRPDRWAEKGPWIWAGLPALALLLAVLLPLTLRLARKAPALLNIPRKDLYLDLPPGARERVLERVGTFLEATALLTTLLLGAMQAAIWHAARTGSASTTALLGGTVVWTGVVVGGALLLNRRLRRTIEGLHRRHRAGAPVEGEGAGT
jgi:hypothetical protein